MISQLQAAVESSPAGGSAIGQVIGMTVGVSAAFLILIWIGEKTRSGERTWLGALGAFSERLSGLPAWSGIPLAVAALALISALFGYMWDVSLHLDDGRDAGPLANPAHYFILVGLYGVVAAGYLTTVLVKPGEKPGKSAIRLGPGREIPLGGVVIGACGLFAFGGFPLDDVWHRLFGQDVTLWGPTHLIMLSGGLLTLVGIALLFQEGVACSRRKPGQPQRDPAKTPLAKLADFIPDLPVGFTRVLVAGGMLAGLSIYQGEFDYGIPQFELLLQPLMIALSAGVALVCARIWIGRGGALAAVAFYLVIRGLTSIVVGPILGETTPAAPLYIPEALCVELAALVFASRPAAATGKSGISRPVAFGAVAGALIGTAGFAGESLWINAIFPIHWTNDLMPEGLVVAALGGLASGMAGAVIGLSLRREFVPRRIAQGVGMGALATIVACFAFGTMDQNPSGVKADVTLTNAQAGPNRTVNATVQFTPANVADGSNWVRTIAWQGGGRLVGGQMERIGEGRYRSTEPLPVYGTWKTAIRVHNGHSLISAQVYAPKDTAIPKPEVPASAHFVRELQPDRVLLQRERNPDVSPWLWTSAGLTVFFMAVGFLVMLGWALARFVRGPAEKQEARPRKPVVSGTPSEAGMQ